jgi:hypothetical protein
MAKVHSKPERHFRISHTMVGGFPKGRIVSEVELQAHSADIPRLIRVGAIVESTAPVTLTPLPAGPFNSDASDSGSEAPPIMGDSSPDDVRTPTALSETEVEPDAPEEPEQDPDEDEDEEDEDEDEDDGRVVPPAPPASRRKAK